MTDLEIIEKLGGVLAISEHLGMDYQRVFNWTYRGIPSRIKVDYPNIFMPNNLDDIQPLKIQSKKSMDYASIA